MLVRFLSLWFLLLPLLPSSAARKATVITPPCFNETPGITACVDPAFGTYWERNGGLITFGYPIGPALPEETPVGPRLVQHFERNWLEFHPDAPAPYTIQLGRVGAELLQEEQRSVSDSPAKPQPGCRFFKETAHNICGIFLTYWQTHGLDLGDQRVSERESIALLGLPLTEPRWEQNSSGDRVLTQWFERARLEDHGGTIRQGLLNTELQTAQAPSVPAPGYVTVVGDKLMQRGQPVILKGTNYYPAAHAWRDMWLEWDGPAVTQDLIRARNELGINTVRIMIPYRSYEGWTDDEGNVKPEMLNRLREFIQIAGQQQLKVLVTLFDWHDSDAAAGSLQESYDLRYLRTIVGAFNNDDRVLAWDLHNEPDNYGLWQSGRAPQVVDWLGRMADAVRAIDRNHPITIGVGRYASLWQAAPDGRTIADISDILSVHEYYVGKFATIAKDLRSRSNKPVLLEEFGWASGPECRTIYFDEPNQLYLYYDEPSQYEVYRRALAVAQQHGLAGVFSWWLQDPPATSTYSVDEQGHYGLYRRDGQPKPAVAAFRSMRVSALPSTTTTHIRLTVVTPPPWPVEHRPLIFDDGIVLHGDFLYFWRFFGGETVFGRPLTLAFRDHTGTIVQYFERARLELNEDTNYALNPLAPEMQSADVYLDRVRLTPLGQQALGSQPVARVADPAQPEVRYFPETGHTLRGDFRKLWETHGARFFGLPLTEAYEETREGRKTRIQYFANWRFEQQGNGPIQFTPLGADMLKVRPCPRAYQ